MNNQILNKYLRVSETTEAYNAIMMFEEFLKHTKQDVYYFKWAILAIHNALQEFMVLALRGTCNLPITKQKKEYKGKTIIEILFDPEPKLKDFLDLFKMIKCEKNMQKKPFIDKNGIVTKHIKELNEARNDFIHYMPKRWSIGIQGLTEIFIDTLKVISFLTGECDEVRRNFVVQLEEQRLKDTDNSIKTCNALLVSILNP